MSLRDPGNYMEYPDGGPAFPSERDTFGNGIYQTGISKREYFAGVALQALIAKLPIIDQKGEHGTALTAEEKAQWMRDIALSAYDYADHMLQVGKR